MSIGIYKITNLLNNKIYVGQSTNIEKRFYQHTIRNQQYIDQEIQKYGKENFSFEILETCLPEQLNEREIYWIDYFKSYDNGYNQNPGGNTGGTSQKITKKQVLEIIELLKTTSLTNEEIGILYSISENMVSGINTGYYWNSLNIKYPIRQAKKQIQHFCIDCGNPINSSSIRCSACAAIASRKVERPEKETLSSMLFSANGNFTLVAKQFNVTDNTIRKWCKAYNLPFHSADYKQQLKEPTQTTKASKIGQYNKDTLELIQIFPSIREAEKQTKIYHITEASDPNNTKRKTAGGYIWKRL